MPKISIAHSLSCSYGEIGHELVTIAVRYMFPDSEDVWGPFAPLSYAVVLREVLVPEAVTRIVQADLKITAKSAKAVISHSYRFGLVRHPASTDSPAIEAAIRYTMQNDQAVFRAWLASESTLGLDEWREQVKQAKVK
jgi:hypothetical protein